MWQERLAFLGASVAQQYEQKQSKSLLAPLNSAAEATLEPRREHVESGFTPKRRSDLQYSFRCSTR